MLNLARLLIIFGIALVVIGGVLYLFARMGISLDRIPGNLKIQGQNLTCVFALGASILLSLILTILINLLMWWQNK